MINFVLGTNFLRALVTDDTGAPIVADAVTASLKITYGADIFTNQAMNHIVGQATYNYQCTWNISASEGVKYEVTIVVTAGANTRTKIMTAGISND